MSKTHRLFVVLFIFNLFISYSCYPQKQRAEEAIIDCLYGAYDDNGVAFKNAISQYEAYLIKENFLIDDSGKGYKATFTSLSQQENFDNLPQLSMDSFISNLEPPNLGRLTECQKKLADSSNYDYSKMIAVNKILEKHSKSKNLQPNLILSDLAATLSEEDFEFDYYKFQTYIMFGIFAIDDSGLIRELPELEDEDMEEQDLSNALNISIDSNDSVILENKETGLSAIGETVRAYYLKNTSESIVVLSHSRETFYQTYIDTQNEIVEAINKLREEYAMELYQKNFDSLSKEEKMLIRKKYPLNLVEKILD